MTPETLQLIEDLAKMQASDRPDMSNQDYLAGFNDGIIKAAQTIWDLHTGRKFTRTVEKWTADSK